MIDYLINDEETESDDDGNQRGVRRIDKRETTKAENPTALAFVFERGVPRHAYDVTVAQWSEAAYAHLRNLGDALKSQTPRIDIPVVSLRGRLELADPANLRLERSVGRYGRTVLWTQTDAHVCSATVNTAVLGWLVDDVTHHARSEMAEQSVEQLKKLARDRRAIEAFPRKVSPYTWDETLSKTAKAISSTSYADLADFVARQLEGKEIFPELFGGLRRIASGQLEQNQAELMTEPIVVGKSRFSLVVRVRIISYPGRPMPVIVIEFSRRVWTAGIKANAIAKTLRAYALPDGVTRAFQFTLCRTKGEDGKWIYQPDDDFAPIARQYFVGESLTTDVILKNGHELNNCKLMVVLKQGVGERSDVKSGVPDLDKLEGFDRVVDALAEINLKRWGGLQFIDSLTRPVKDRDQHWGKRDSEKAPDLQKYETWLAEAQHSIRECYAGEHHIVIAVQQGFDVDADASLAQARLNEILQGSVITTRIPISPNVHGPRHTLPGKEIKNPAERAATRIEEWSTFIETVKRYETDLGRKIDGVLVIAREWYPNKQHDDNVNKRAARIALANGLGVPVQYLRPRQEFREEYAEKPKRGKPKSPDEIAAAIDRDFENRLMIAWLDLAYKSLGHIRPSKLIEKAQKVYNIGTYPDRILALGVVRRNISRFLSNERSFLPYAIELDVESGVCSASFAYEHAATRTLTWTDSLPLPQALVTLAGLGPVQLATATATVDRKKQLIERTQVFFKDRLAEFGQRSQYPLVLVDADSSRSIWSWLKDEEIDAHNVRLADGFHAQADWPHARLVRIRTNNSPKVLWDAEFYGRVKDSDEEVRYRAPVWAEAQLFKITDTVKTDVYLSFGSAIRTSRTRGKSCYRTIQGMKEIGRTRRYLAVTMDRHNDAWTTPAGLEIFVVRAGSDQPNQVAQLVEWLRQCYTHFGEWTSKPAPLFFESILKQYLADYELEENEPGVDDNDDGEE